MTDAYTDLSSLNKTYREMVEGCGCDKGKAKDNKKPTKPNIKESLSATCLFTEEELDNIIEKMTAFDMVKKSLSDKGALMDSSKMKRRGITPEEQARRSKNYADNNKNYDPYKSRAGESD